MKEFLERVENLSTLVIITFVCMIIAGITAFFAPITYSIFFGIIALIFAVLSLRE